MPMVISVPLGMRIPPSCVSSVVIRLPSWFELSKRSTSSTALFISVGLVDQAPPRVRKADENLQRIADQVGRGLVTGIEDEDAVLRQLGFGELAPFMLAGDQPRQQILLRIARIAAAILDQSFQIGGKLAHRVVAELRLLRRQHRLERAEDRERPAAQRTAIGMRHAEQVADDLDRNGGGEILDQVGAALSLHRVEQPVDQRDRAPPPSRRSRGSTAPSGSRGAHGCAAADR